MSKDARMALCLSITWSPGTSTSVVSLAEMDLRDKRGIFKPVKVKGKLHGRWQKEYIFLQYSE